MVSSGQHPRVALVSDSTSVRHRLREHVGVTVVPLQVVIDGEVYDECDVCDDRAEPDPPDGQDSDAGPTRTPADHEERRAGRRRDRQHVTTVDLGGRTQVTAAEVARALRARQQVSTSRPAPERFAETYRRLASEGFDEVVSIHLSSQMSGTYESALIAARDVDLDVHVVDSRQVDMGTGFAVQEAARAIAAHADAATVARAAASRASRVRSLFYVDTLEYLRRGGRVGAAAAFVGSALAVKPLLQVQDGRIVPLERVRTAGRALARLTELACAHAGDSRSDLAVSHLAAPERADDLAERLRESLPSVGTVTVGEVGSVIGAHVGPGAVAVTLSTVEPPSTGGPLPDGLSTDSG